MNLFRKKHRPAAPVDVAIATAQPAELSDELTTYQSFARVGEKYTDSNTGFTGYCVAVQFSEFACEQAVLEAVVDGTLKSFGFDVPRLVHVETNTRGSWSKPGGPTEELNRGLGRPAPLGLR